MRLSEFILSNMEAILVEWERFAKTLPPGRNLSTVALRNDAERMLHFIAADIETTQTAQQQQDKSEGHGPEAGGSSAAHDHGVQRLGEGFTLNELVAEYRALRASVLRLWLDGRSGAASAVDQIIRFNEAIDQAIAESVLRFSAEADHARDLLLAMLGHDLRNPLNAISMSAQVVEKAPDRAQDAAAGIHRSAERMRVMIADLLDFARTRLGSRLPVQTTACDLGSIFGEVVAELRAAHPTRRFDYTTTGDLAGHWDRGRAGQLASNLVGNAVQHGDPGAPIGITVDGHAQHVEVAVRNLGLPIAPADARAIFDPLVRAPGSVAPDRSASLGLGLYIAKQIANAHGGDVTLRSSDERGTVFAVVLPRRVPAVWSIAGEEDEVLPLP